MTTNKEIEAFYEYVKSYRYIDETTGRLDLESFCVILSKCFGCDGILDLSPQPRDVYDLLVEKLAEKDASKMGLWVQVVPITDWEPVMDFMYPDKTITHIHVAGLLQVFPEWISQIGYRLMGLPYPDPPDCYYAWAKPEWTFVHTFINGFHETFFTFLKDNDRRMAAESGVSLFEAFFVSTTTPDTSFDDATRRLANRSSAQQEALDRIRTAIAEGYFLEAIALEESIISNCFYLYCTAKGIVLKETSLYVMLTAIKRRFREDSTFAGVDKWRRDRNHAMHSFVTARSDDLNQSRQTFATHSKATARTGLTLAEAVCAWYGREAPDFVTTSWAVNRSPTH